MKNEKVYDIAILGAGASGMMSAIAARCSGSAPSIAVPEKNDKAGRKLYATGNGRCNLLNRTAVPGDYRSGEGNAPAFAADVFAQCGPAQLRKVFERLGLDTVEEDGGRLYPRSLQAASVVRALERGAFGCGPGDPAELICGFEAKEARKDPDGSFRVTAADGRCIKARRLLIAAGGKAGIQYGCDGRGLKIAESLGHRIVRPIPALTGFVCEETDLLEKLAGVRVRGTVRLNAQEKGGGPVLLSEDTGEVQFNRDSVSGICVMNVSGFYRRRGEEKFSLQLDFMPEIDETTLEEKLTARRERLGDYFLDALLPEKLAAAVMELATPEGQTPGSVARLLKGLILSPAASRGWKDAHTTSGGIALDEIDPKTLESKRVPGLYAAGEALDVDGPCGGYSLTWAFASGWIAGQNAARNR